MNHRDAAAAALDDGSQIVSCSLNPALGRVCGSFRHRKALPEASVASAHDGGRTPSCEVEAANTCKDCNLSGTTLT